MNKVIEQIRAIATEHPHFVYTSQAQHRGGCSYVAASRHLGDGDERGVGCIVGQAMVRVGTTDTATLRAWEENEDGGDVNDVVDKHPEWLADADEDEAAWMGAVQYEQDRGASWGRAVAAADQTYPKAAHN